MVMTQAEKDILLKELCARIPYRVKCLYDKNDIISPIYSVDVFSEEIIGVLNPGVNDAWSIDKCKLFLRPLNTMTDEENKELELISESVIVPWENNYFHIEDNYSWGTLYNTIDYLNAHHFDYRGLIAMGLAVEAPKDIYKFET